MSWLLEPGSIEHIDHMWQPTKGWGTALMHLDVALNDFECLVSHKTNYNTLYIEQFVWTVKIDDRISLRVSKIGGKYGVSYKTLSNSWLYSEDDVAASYWDQPWIGGPLNRMLAGADAFFKPYEDDIGYQVGYLHPDFGDFSGGAVPLKITPNVTTYTFPWEKNAGYMAVTPIIKFRYKDGKPVSMTQEVDWDWFQSKPNLVTIDPRPVFPETPNREKFDALKAAREEFDRLRAPTEVLAELESYYAHIRMYLNKMIREGMELADGDNEAEAFIEWYIDVHEQSAEKLKTERGKAARIDRLEAEVSFLQDRRGHLEVLFETVVLLKKIRDAVLDLASDYALKNGVTQHPIAEGLVVTRNVGNSLMAFKFVPESFSKTNFDKNG